MNLALNFGYPDGKMQIERAAVDPGDFRKLADGDFRKRFVLQKSGQAEAEFFSGTEDSTIDGAAHG